MDEKHSTATAEDVASTVSPTNDGEHAPTEMIDEKPYWRTAKFVGTFWAIGFGVLACYAGFSMPANTLALINTDIGMLSVRAFNLRH